MLFNKMRAKSLMILLVSVNLSGLLAMPMQGNAETSPDANRDLAEQRIDSTPQDISELVEPPKRRRVATGIEDQDDYDEFDDLEEISAEDVAFHQATQVLKNHIPQITANTESEILMSTLTFINLLNGEIRSASINYPTADQFDSVEAWEAECQKIVLDHIWMKIGASNRNAAKRPAVPSRMDITSATIDFIEARKKDFTESLDSLRVSPDEFITDVASEVKTDRRILNDAARKARRKQLRLMIEWLGTFLHVTPKERDVVIALIRYLEVLGYSHSASNIERIKNEYDLLDVLAQQLPGEKTIQRGGGQIAVNELSRTQALALGILLIGNHVIPDSANQLMEEIVPEISKAPRQGSLTREMHRSWYNQNRQLRKITENDAFNELADYLHMPIKERKPVNILQTVIEHIASLGYTSPLSDAFAETDVMTLYDALAQQISIQKPVQRRRGPTPLYEVSKKDVIEGALRFINLHWDTMRVYSEMLSNPEASFLNQEPIFPAPGSANLPDQYNHLLTEKAINDVTTTGPTNLPSREEADRLRRIKQTEVRRQNRLHHLSLVAKIADVLQAESQKEEHTLQELIEHFDSIGMKHQTENIRKILDIKQLYDILATQLPGGKTMQRTGGQTGLHEMSRTDALTKALNILTGESSTATEPSLPATTATFETENHHFGASAYGLTTFGLEHLSDSRNILLDPSDLENAIQEPLNLVEMSAHPLQVALSQLSGLVPHSAGQLTEQSILESTIKYLDELNDKTIDTAPSDPSLDAVSILYGDVTKRLPGSWDISSEKSRTILLQAVFQHIQHLQMMKAFLENAE